MTPKRGREAAPRLRREPGVEVGSAGEKCERAKFAEARGAFAVLMRGARENGMPLDTRGTFYDGTPINTPAELARALMKRPVPLVRTFTENLLAYALGRRTEYFDQPAIRAIAKTAESNDYRMSSFILGVVKSDAFQMKRAEPMTTDDTKVTRARQ